jgi:tRNA(adenine34) deaminase
LREKMRRDDDQRWMDLALAEAMKAEAMGEVPIGCVIVSGSEIIGRGHNLRERDQDPTAHAEMIAVREAAKRLGGFRVTAATLYVTCEPCPMCAGAIVNARIDRLVYGCHDPKAGACGTLYNIPADTRLNHRVEVVAGVMEEECAEILSRFFRSLRDKTRP